MGPRCIFFTDRCSPACQLFSALGLRDICAADQALLRQQFCENDNFVECPLFQQAERGLAHKHVRLSRRRRAGAAATGTRWVRPGPTALESCDGAMR